MAFFVKATDDGVYEHKRTQDMQMNKETWRRQGRQMLEVTENKLNDTTLPQWKRDAMEIKRDLLIEVVDGKSRDFTTDEVREILSKLTLDMLLTKNTELVTVVENDPDQMQSLLEVIGMSEIIQKQVAYNASVNNNALASCAFADGIAGDMEGFFKEEMKNRQIAAKTLVDEGLMEAVPNNMQGVKQLFSNSLVTDRLAQLVNARKMIPEELLTTTKVGVVSKRVGDELVKVQEEYQDVENRTSLELNDPRVIQTFNELRNAAQNEPAKVNEGPAMGMGG